MFPRDDLAWETATLGKGLHKSFNLGLCKNCLTRCFDASKFV